MATADELFAEHGVDGVMDPEPLEPDTPEPDTTVAVAEPEPEPAPTPRQVAAAERKRREDGTFDKGKAKREALAALDDTPVVDPLAEPEPVAEAPPETPPEPEVAIQPWKVGWKVKGVPVDVPLKGAQYKPGYGVFLPEKDEAGNPTGNLDLVRQQMLQATKVPELRAQLDRARSQLNTGMTRDRLESAAIARVFAPFLHPETGLAALQAAAQDPLTIERWRLALQQAQYEIQQQAAGPVYEAPKDGQPSPEVVQEVYSNIDDVFDRVIQAVWPDIAPVDRDDLERRIAVPSRIAAFLEKAKTDDPEGRWTQGQIAVNQDEMQAYVLGVKHAMGRTTPPVVPSATALPPKGPPPAKAPAKPVTQISAPPAAGGPARNLTGTGSGKKPRHDDDPFTSKKDVRDYFG